MQVYALIGPSGTGKSHHAPFVAYERNIPVIVDDGLLIKNNRVIAGISAKRERTRFGAVKRAILKDQEHANSLRQKIQEIKPDKILILATSRRMAQKIADRLEIPPPHHYISIEEQVPHENIQKALQIRQKENQHVIPIPTFALKKDFPGYLIAPLRSFLSRAHAEHKEIAMERSVIRPVYSSLGNFLISEQVLVDLSMHICENLPGIRKVNKVNIYTNDSGVTMELQLTVYYNLNIKEALVKAQWEIKEKIECLTGFYLKGVHIVAQKLYLPGLEEEYASLKKKSATAGKDQNKEIAEKEEEAEPKTSPSSLKIPDNDSRTHSLQTTVELT